MAFENIDCIKPAAPATKLLPDDGVTVTPRHLGTKNGRMVHFIKVKIGEKLSRNISLTAADHRLRLLFGTDADAGKIMVSVDNDTGKFVAKRDARGRYSLTINAATADGLFALQFPAFTRDGLQALRPLNGKPPHFVFQVTPEMLTLAD